ncbi:Transcriptional regulator, LysR family [Labilithrix luteola]|uniref:Transcriptional regulator, LysR family n=1 Tax=Labilithrix luteola TaxID=1391654 RepID=A0A0K1PK31_9BACT|nr:LysR family transcriptional regulator [Labilithrix luteola]AKU93469.1 Transcriptional regulator, LysR family [Labilithrix luteola]
MTAPIDRLASMETFLRIVDAGSLSAAAKQLGTSQPTVSRRLRALESTLGVPLLKRSTHAIQLTETGERYVARARDLLAEWRSFEAGVRGDDDEPEGTLRVVVPHAFGQEQLVGPATRFLRAYPKVTIEWLLSDGPIRLVEDGIDCVIRVGALQGDALVARKIHDVKRIVVASPALLARRPPTRPAQLTALPWLALRTFYRNRVRLEKAGAVATLDIRPRFFTDSLYALRTAALDGTGAAVVSEWMVRGDIQAGALVHLLPSWSAPSLPVYIAYPQAKLYPTKLRAFVDAMKQGFEGQ